MGACSFARSTTTVRNVVLSTCLFGSDQIDDVMKMANAFQASTRWILCTTCSSTSACVGAALLRTATVTAVRVFLLCQPYGGLRQVVAGFADGGAHGKGQNEATTPTTLLTFWCRVSLGNWPTQRLTRPAERQLALLASNVWLRKR
eukprot:SAG11_NODE_2984_length_2791_cov_1.161961_5_plen_146_part_00